MAHASHHQSPSPRNPAAPWFIAGPTAVGKSQVALLLAEQLHGEIITVDSMQVYRGLDIGTAKPTAQEQARVPHHLVGVLDLNESFDAAKFCSHARLAMNEIQARGHTPVFCGGTGLYFKAFLEGLGEAPPSDGRLRAELEALPLTDLLEELAEADPAAYETIDRQNSRRVIRAVEVIRLTGRPMSAQRGQWGGARCGQSGSASPIFVLSRDKPDLDSRINARVDAMFSTGLVEETRELLKRGLEGNPTAMQAIGYRQVVEHLRGKRSLVETVELVKSRTRQYARRQLTWFRGQADAQWVDVQPQEPADKVVGRLLGCFPP